MGTSRDKDWSLLQKAGWTAIFVCLAQALHWSRPKSTGRFPFFFEVRMELLEDPSITHTGTHDQPSGMFGGTLTQAFSPAVMAAPTQAAPHTSREEAREGRG